MLRDGDPGDHRSLPGKHEKWQVLKDRYNSVIWEFAVCLGVGKTCDCGVGIESRDEEMRHEVVW